MNKKRYVVTIVRSGHMLQNPYQDNGPKQTREFDQLEIALETFKSAIKETVCVQLWVFWQLENRWIEIAFAQV